MEIINLSDTNSILNQCVDELRNINVQGDRERFRRNVERAGAMMAYELSKRLNYRPVKTTTPLGESSSDQLVSQPVIATILRAGLPLQQGMNYFFNHADLAYISAYRNYTVGNEFEVIVEYLACPPLNGRTLIITDPMLASGLSLELCYNELIKAGEPEDLHLVSVIASKAGVEHVQRTIGKGTLWVAAIDEELNDHGYIVPGLGDAGDLSFGEKL